MKDFFLLDKISNSLYQICSQYKIERIEQFDLVIDQDSHINKENLIEHLKLHNTDIIAKEFSVEIQKEDLGGEAAIIKNIKIEVCGTK